MKVNFTNQVVRDMVDGIDAIINNPQAGEYDQKFNYALHRTKDLLEGPFKSLLETQKTALKEYEDKRIALCKQHAAKEPKTQEPIQDRDPRTGTLSFRIADQPLFNIELERLKEQYKPALEKVEKLYEEKVEVDIYQVEEAFIPKMHPALYGAIRHMVKVKAEN